MLAPSIPTHQRRTSRVVRALLATLIVVACSDNTPTAPVGRTIAAADPAKAAGDTKGRIVFVSNRDFLAGSEIYTMKANGSGVSRLTVTQSYNEEPSWSRDGRKIVYVSRPSSGNTDVFVMNADGTGVQQLTFTPEREQAPTWSRDGSQIAFVSERDGDPEIYVMQADGSGVVRLTYSPGFDWSPTWSPDGRRIAFTSERVNPGNSMGELYTMDPDGSRVTRLTLEQQFINDLTWEPRGRQIAFSTQTGIYLVGSDGTQLRQIVSDADGGGSEPTWSPDGGRIAFTSDRVGGLEIYSMNPDGTAQTRLTHAPASVRAHWGR